jgi:hypothetical protein
MYVFIVIAPPPEEYTPDHVHLGYEGYGGYDREIAKLLD